MRNQFRLLSGCAVAAIFVAIGSFWLGQISATQARTQVISGTFMTLSIDHAELAFQPNRSTTGSSYAYGADITWIHGGVVHQGGVDVCLKRGRKIQIGVVTARPVGSNPGGVLLSFISC